MKKIYILTALVMLFTLASCGLEKEEAMMKDDAMMQDETMMGKDMMQETSGEDAIVKDDAMMKDDPMMEKTEDEVMMKDEAMMEKTEDTMMVKGSYVAYASDMLGKTENTVVFFHANWCPSCRAADAGISAGSIPENLTILKADYDSETELKKKYGVTTQHTFVLVDAQGEMIKKWVGGTSVEDVVGKL